MQGRAGKKHAPGFEVTRSKHAKRSLWKESWVNCSFGRLRSLKIVRQVTLVPPGDSMSSQDITERNFAEVSSLFPVCSHFEPSTSRISISGEKASELEIEQRCFRAWHQTCNVAHAPLHLCFHGHVGDTPTVFTAFNQLTTAFPANLCHFRLILHPQNPT